MINRDFRVAWAIAILDLRRWLTMTPARLQHQEQRRRSAGLWMLILVPILLLQGTMLACIFLAAAERPADHRLVVNLACYYAVPARGTTEGEQSTPQKRQDLLTYLERDPWLRTLSPSRRKAHIDNILEASQTQGRAVFALREPIPYILVCTPPTDPQARGQIGNTLVLGVAFFLLSVVALRIGLGNRDLGRTDDPRAWLRTLPISNRALALARWLSGLIDPIAWLVLGPIMIAIALRHGGPGSIWPGLIQLALLVVIASAIAVALEELVRCHLTATGQRWVQAIASFLGMTLFVAMVAAGAVPALAEFIFGATAWLPTWTGQLLIPPSGASAWIGPLATLSLAVLAGIIGLQLVRVGHTDLVEVQSKPRRLANQVWSPLSALGKELLVLRSDPKLLLTIVLLPGLLVVSILLLAPDVVGMALADPRHLAMAALVAGGFAANIAAQHIIPVDQPHLWLLWTTPMAIGRILVTKSVVIAAVAGGVCLVGLSAGSVVRPDLAWAWLVPYTLLAVTIHATCITGLVSLNFEPSSNRRRIKQSPANAMTGLLVLGLLISGPYAGWWATCVSLVLVAIGAMAVWQRAHERLRWLMDPGSLPPPRLDALVGIGAVMGFAILQVPVALVVGAMQMSPSAGALIAFIATGLIANIGALLSLHLTGLRGILSRIGILPNDGSQPESKRSLVHLLIGIVIGLAAALWATGWLALVDHLDLKVVDARSVIGKGPLAILAIGVAPLVEEVLFRGLLLGGLVTSLRPRWSILGSTLVFAALHPPLSFPAVAALGLACGILYHQTRWLLAPIACHASYNLLVMLLGN